MLEFFRTYQKYFFIFITTIIVISFSFFGTYSALSENSFREQIAFKAVDGTDITRHELDEMVRFLKTDGDDKLLFGGIWGPNFLNDGVIKKNFLETGLAYLLATTYANEMKPDLIARIEKEKRYALYAHPQASFINVESAWNYFSPQMSTLFYAMKNSSDPTSSASIQARIGMFLLERQFPSPLLKQVLMHQERQYNFVTPDKGLAQADLSLFGYHTMEDWFGPRFMNIAAEFIINSAIIAEQRGYEVTKTEALADLMRNSEASFQQNRKNPQLGVTSSHEYFEEQLRLLQLDRNAAAKVWRQVLLFRRLFTDLGSSVFVDPFSFEKLNSYALASVEGQMYKLPKALRIGDFKTLQKLELYLDAVAKRNEEEKAKLGLPTAFLTLEEVSQKTPELVQKRYILEFSQVDKAALEANVGVKDSWEWEVSNEGWEQLKKQFPELGTKPGKTRDERFASLDTLDDKTRSRVDAFARKSIVDTHPEWIAAALESATPTHSIVGISERGGKTPFTGLENGKELMELLDAAPLTNKKANSYTAQEKDAQDKLNHYSPNKTTFYAIRVIDRDKQPGILTFAEADEKGVLDLLLDKQLEAHYAKIRDGNPSEYQNNDKTWKSFDDARDSVAKNYYESTLNTIRKAYTSSVKEAPEQMIPDYAASLRLYPYMKSIADQAKKNPKILESFTKAPTTTSNDESKLAAREKLADQWKLEQVHYTTNRGKEDKLTDKTELFSLAEGNWSKVNTPANGEINFIQLEKKGTDETANTVTQSVSRARLLLSSDAQQQLMASLLKIIEEKHAISIDYLNQKTEMEPVASAE